MDLFDYKQFLKLEPGLIKLHFQAPNSFCRLVYLPKSLIQILDKYTLTSHLEIAHNIFCLSKCNQANRLENLSKILSYGSKTKHALSILPLNCRPEHDYYKNNSIKLTGKNLSSFLKFGIINKDNYAFCDSSLIDIDEYDWLLVGFKKIKLKKEISLEDFVLATGLGKVSVLGDSIFLEGYPYPLHSLTFYKALFSYYLGKEIELKRRYKTKHLSAEFSVKNEVSE